MGIRKDRVIRSKKSLTKEKYRKKKERGDTIICYKIIIWSYWTKKHLFKKGKRKTLQEDVTFVDEKSFRRCRLMLIIDCQR